MEKYALKYTYDYECRDEGFTEEDSNDGEFGLCDALLCVSITRKNGTFSMMPFSFDGDTKKENILPTHELFNIMLVMANCLTQEEDIDPYLKELLKEMVYKVKKYKTDGKFKASF
jgi:hypothetical protein